MPQKFLDAEGNKIQTGFYISPHDFYGTPTSDSPLSSNLSTLTYVVLSKDEQTLCVRKVDGNSYRVTLKHWFAKNGQSAKFGIIPFKPYQDYPEDVKIWASQAIKAGTFILEQFV